MHQLIKHIEQWAEDRNLINGSTPQKQMLKLMEEFGELCGGIARNNPEMIKDAIGDLIVVCIIKAMQEKQPIFPVQFEHHRLNGYRFNMQNATAFLMDIEYIDNSRSKYSRFFGILHDLSIKNGFTLKDCVQHAYDQIKDRKGKMVEGVFVKEEDLNGEN